jgi:hypothetical protein
MLYYEMAVKKPNETSERTSGNKGHDNIIPWQGLKNWQPSPELKKAWRERKRQAQIIMDKMLRYGEMTVEEIKAEISSKWEKMTVQDYLITKYVLAGTKSEKMLVDRMDRHISKAPTQIDQNVSWAVAIGELSEKQKKAIKSLKKDLE